MTANSAKPGEWRRIKELFQTAIELDAVQRADFLAANCDTPTIRIEVESLIASHECAGDFIETPAAELDLYQQADKLLNSDAIIGTRIGPYQVVSELGHGGMGEVFLAVRADEQFNKKVAIKIIRNSMNTAEIRRRFHTERQILARLEHPNIARLLDGGTTEDGRPFVVMEYIEGESIDEYCDTHSVSIRERLKLFRTVCAAVHFAHQNLVVHRDIKPSNIFITHDGVPKLLDFGIAKVLDNELMREPAATAPAFRMLTPEYASPDQLRGEAITTASDVYSLGVLLYQLLTGHHPYRLESRNAREIEQIVCEREPERPSQIISRSYQLTNSKGEVNLTPESVSRLRNCPPEKLRRQLNGDLDNIVLKAMRKERAARYNSVEQFSEDISRHLRGLPVIAGKDSFRYRAGKFIRRHTVEVSAALLILLALLGGIVATTWQARKAERRFNDIRKIANSFLFEFHDAIENLPGSTPARKLVVSKALEYLDKLAKEAGNDASLQRELASAYEKVGDVQGNPYKANLGNSSGALESYRKALAIYQLLLKANPADAETRRSLAGSYTRIGDLLIITGDTNGAMENIRKALAIRESLAADEPENRQVRYDLAQSDARLGDVLSKVGETAQALSEYRRALVIRESLAALDTSDLKVRHDLIVSHSRIGDMLAANGNTNAALASYQRSQEISQTALKSAPNNAEIERDLAVSYSRIGDVLIKTGDLASALENFYQSRAISERLAAADQTNAKSQRDLTVIYNRIADLRSKRGELNEALELYRQSLAINEQMLQSDPNNTTTRRNLSISYSKLGETFARLDNIEAARENYQRSLKIDTELLNADPANTLYRRDVAYDYRYLGDMLASSDSRAALEQFRAAALLFESLSKANPANAEARRDLSAIYSRVAAQQLPINSAREALAELTHAIEINEQLAAADTNNALTRRDLAENYQLLGQIQFALSDTEAACRAYQQSSTNWQALRERGALQQRDKETIAGLERAMARCGR